MYCWNCGAEVKEGNQFCQDCGSRQETASSQQLPVQQVVKKSPKKTPVGIIASAVAVVLVIVLLFVFMGSPSAKVGKALAKSGKAFVNALEKTKLTNITDLAAEKDLSQDISFRLSSVEGDSALKGAGVRMSVDSSLSGRVIGVGVTPYFGSADLLNLHLKLDNDKIYVGSPELIENSYFMVNTATIGEDLNRLLGTDEAENLSFNIFDLVEQSQKIAAVDEEMEKALRKAGKELVKEIEVEKEGSKTVEVNGQDLKCAAYHVVITEDSLDQLLDTLEDVYMDKLQETNDAYIDMIKATGLPDDVIDELEYTLEDNYVTTEYTFENLHDVLDELGDVELDLYINKGYVVAAVYENTLDGSDVELVVQVGGGDKYVDDISLRLDIDDDAIIITSSGNHTGAGGEFTDETVIKEGYNGKEYTVAELEMSYAPKEKNDNFEWEMKVDGEKFTAEGQITCSKESVSVNLEKVKLDDYMTFALEYQLGKYEGDGIVIGQELNLTDMSDEELLKIVMELEENAGKLLEGLMEEYPALEDLLYYY